MTPTKTIIKELEATTDLNVLCEPGKYLVHDTREELQKGAVKVD